MFDGVLDRVGYFIDETASNEFGKALVFFPVEYPVSSVKLFLKIG
jgi:hypothetical protein